MRARTALLASSLLISSLLATAPALAFGPERFAAKAVEIDGVYGSVTVVVDPAARDVTIGAGGSAKWLPSVAVSKSGDTVRLEQKDRPRNMNDRNRDEQITVNVVVPPGTALLIDDQVGDSRIGDLNGPLTFKNMQSGKVRAGSVTTAQVGITGSADVVVGDVAGPAKVAISGSGDVELGKVAGGVDVAVSGSGDIKVGAVDGAVAVSISGSGDVEIGPGRADPLRVDISGSGDVRVAATVVNQTIRNSGSGSVRIGKGG